MDQNPQKLELEYPCAWSYRMIGSDESAIRALVAELLGETEYTLVYGHRSRTGKYCSLQLDLIVQSEAHRQGLHTALSQAAFIKAIL